MSAEEVQHSTAVSKASQIWDILESLPGERLKVGERTFEQRYPHAAAEMLPQGSRRETSTRLVHEDLPEILQKAMCLRTLEPLFEAPFQASEQQTDLSASRRHFYQLTVRSDEGDEGESGVSATMYQSAMPPSETVVLFLSQPARGRVTTRAVPSRIERFLKLPVGDHPAKFTVSDPVSAGRRLVTYRTPEYPNAILDSIPFVGTLTLSNREFKHYRVTEGALDYYLPVESSPLEARWESKLFMLSQATCAITMKPMIDGGSLDAKKAEAKRRFSSCEFGFWEYVKVTSAGNNESSHTHLFISENALRGLDRVHALYSHPVEGLSADVPVEPNTGVAPTTETAGVPMQSGQQTVAEPSVVQPRPGLLSRCEIGEDFESDGQLWKSHKHIWDDVATNTKHIWYEYAVHVKRKKNFPDMSKLFKGRSSQAS